MHARSLKGRKFSREAGPRRALLRSLATSLILYEKIRTTKPKAKETQRIVEKLITLAKDGSLSSIRRLDAYLLHKNASKKLVLEIAPLYKERNGGYTRVINASDRVGDAAPMAVIELVDTEKLDQKTEKTEKDTKGAKKIEKKKEASVSKKSEIKEPQRKKAKEKK